MVQWETETSSGSGSTRTVEDRTHRNKGNHRNLGAWRVYQLQEENLKNGRISIKANDSRKSFWSWIRYEIWNDYCTRGHKLLDVATMWSRYSRKHWKNGMPLFVTFKTRSTSSGKSSILVWPPALSGRVRDPKDRQFQPNHLPKTPG